MSKNQVCKFQTVVASNSRCRFLAQLLGVSRTSLIVSHMILADTQSIWVRESVEVPIHKNLQDAYDHSSADDPLVLFMLIQPIDKILSLDTATLSEESSLVYGTRCRGITQVYVTPTHLSTSGMNHICLCLHSRSWSSFTDPRGMEG